MREHLKWKDAGALEEWPTAAQVTTLWGEKLFFVAKHVNIFALYFLFAILYKI